MFLVVWLIDDKSPFVHVKSVENKLVRIRYIASSGVGVGVGVGGKFDRRSVMTTVRSSHDRNISGWWVNAPNVDHVHCMPRIFIGKVDQRIIK